RQKNPNAKILILDNHDDFGGHAKRNEFHSGGKMLLSFGGSINLEQDAMSPTAYGLLEEIGVDFKALQNAGAEDYSLSNGAAPFGLYLGRSLYGEDQLAAGLWQYTWAGVGDFRAQINSLNLPDNDKAKLISLASGEKDYINDIPLADKEAFLRSTSYASFLYDRVGLSAAGARIAEPWSRAIFGVGIESISIREAVALGAPGYNALGFPAEESETDAAEEEGAYRYPMFPDGNASVARLFVRKLIPEVAAGSSMQSLVTARFDYSTLDRANSAVRLRLNSTAVNVTHHGSVAKSDGVDVAYVSGDQAFTVRGKHCILAGYNGMIPHLCPELPQAQKESLAYGVKTPFVWANVLLRNGAAVRAEQSSVYQCPGSFFELVSHAPPVALGSYQPSGKANDPMVMFMGHVPAPYAKRQTNGAAKSDQSARDLYRLGRHKLFTAPFSEFETAISEQLTGMFGHNGFDAKRDIEAITLNRWSHGYAYEYLDLHDPQWAKGQAPHELGRKPFGRISIANSDSEAYAYVQAAIDAAVRAVGEVSE
ncbi:MAG: spermidine dehydrogenase, partial [Pseudomonadales bacterium]